ncbi:hypothetical protein [Nocardia africana]
MHITASGYVEERKLNAGPPAQLPDGVACTNTFSVFAVAFAPAPLLLRHYNRPSTGGTAH